MFSDIPCSVEEYVRLYEKTGEMRTSPDELLIKDILDRAELEVSLLDILVRDVQIRLLSYLHAGMSEQTA